MTVLRIKLIAAREISAPAVIWPRLDRRCVRKWYYVIRGL